MTEGEKAFLAFTAIGVFSVEPNGSAWKHRRLIAGSHTGTPPYWKDAPKQPAAKSVSDGYPTIMFSDGKQRHKVFLHRVVWMISNQSDIPPGMQVNHIDGDRMNAKPENLEVVTPSQNVIHSIRILGRKPKAQSGETNVFAKLTNAQVLEIRRFCTEKQIPQRKIAEMFGVKQQTVSNIHNGRTWTHIAEDSTG